MELFRTISPNGGSLSAIEDAPRSFYGQSPHTVLDARFKRYGYMNTPHTSTSFSPVHWKDPEKFDPDRYKAVPTSDQIDEARCKQIGLARCPFDITSFKVADGRKGDITNSGFGTVFGVVDGKPLPITDYETTRGSPRLASAIGEDFLRKVWKDKIEYVRLNLPSPGGGPDRADRRHRRRHSLHPERLTAANDAGRLRRRVSGVRSSSVR